MAAPRAVKPTKGTPVRRRRWLNWLSAGVVVALGVTVAVVSQGFDARETSRDEPSVWAMRASGQYARVNTETAEIDTVRIAESASGVLQSGARTLVLTNGGGRAWGVNPAEPQDLREQEEVTSSEQDHTAAPESSHDGERETPVLDGEIRVPAGNRETLIAGDFVLFRTEEGAAYLGTLTGAASSNAGTDTAAKTATSVRGETLLDPFAAERTAAPAEGSAEAPADDEEGNAIAFPVTAAALNDSGRVALYSAHARELRFYEASEGRFETDVVKLSGDVPVEGLEMALLGKDWALYAPDTGTLWTSAAPGGVKVPARGQSHLQQTASDGSAEGLLIADEQGLIRVTDTDRVARVDGTGTGVPTRPLTIRDERYAAWIGADSGTLWQEGAKLSKLALDDQVALPGTVTPVLQTNGTRALLSETQTGMMWTVPEGKLIPVEQWTLTEPPKQEDGAVVVNDATDPEPPVAVNDVFGVRAGEQALLPVMLNDYDPNRKDVLTIVPESVADSTLGEFGSIEMLSNSQMLTARVAEGATGSATFTYRITDGVYESEPATVTLTVKGDEVENPPAWCPVEGCQHEWPSPEVSPGGTLILPILEGYVDPEGDPMLLQAAELIDPASAARVLVSADGRLAFRHDDPNAADEDISVKVTVSDSRGALNVREMRIRVRGDAQPSMTAMALTVAAGEPATIRPLGRVTGGSGAYALLDASVTSGEATATTNAGTGAIEVTSSTLGDSILSVTIRDTISGGETAGVIRVTTVASRPKLAVPPLRAFVRPLSDATIEVLDAIPGANHRGLVVSDVEVRDGQLTADVLEHARVRVSGSTADGAAGRIGSARVYVSEGGTTASGELTVFQVPDGTNSSAIAVADTATVRAGSVVDIAVLDNDLAPAGERLVLHPQIAGSGTKGELAFASGNTLRYLAPSAPGDYTLSYTTYGSSTPESSDTGTVRVTVKAAEGNRDPQPSALTVRLSAGEKNTVRVPLSGVDPDGDRVRLVGVQSTDAQITASVTPRAASIDVQASKQTTPGTYELQYAVRDGKGGEALGLLRVVVTAAEVASIPIAYTDHVRVQRDSSEPLVVQPLDNDVDPAGGTLSIIEVVPNVPGGKESAEYEKLMQRLDLSAMKKGRISVSAGELGTVSFRYRVRSSETQSTADGLIVVQTSERIGQLAPTIRDTLLTTRDRVDLAHGGVDVVTDRVFWAGGDVDNLQLSVWGKSASRFKASGKRITGEYRASGDLVPFKLSGKDANGADIEAFGFLVIPPLDDLRLTLQPGLTPLSVKEGKNVSATLTSLVDIGRGDSVEMATGSMPVQRSQATCTSDGSSIVYQAGKNEPWSDSCVIRVKLSEQTQWTELAVPIAIVPNEPVVTLEPLSRTLSPGETETINLADMVRWEGNRAGKFSNLRFTLNGGDGSFEITQNGSKLSVLAPADAVVGTERAVNVSVSGAGDSQSVLNLRVGVAPKDAPVGGSAPLTCVVGSSCAVAVTALPGSYDPFQDKKGGGLELISVADGACAVASFAVDGDRVVVNWPNGAEGSGGKCTATFTVRDAQKRVGTGAVELDARGVPRAPVSIVPKSADRNSVSLTVSLSQQAAHPAVTGVELFADGSRVGDCTLNDGSVAVCSNSGLTPGVKHTYTARAVNAVGSSQATANGVETWAYEAPNAPTVAAAAVSWPENESSTRGRLRITIGEAGNAERRLWIGGVETPLSASGIYETAAGTQSIAVMAVDPDSALPPAYAGGSESQQNRIDAEAFGAPTLTAKLANKGDTGYIFTTTAAGKGDITLTYGLTPGRGDAKCTGASESGSGLTAFTYYAGASCASSQYGKTRAQAGWIFTSGDVPALTGGQYRVSSNPTVRPGGLDIDGVVAYGATTPELGGKLDGALLEWSTPISELNSHNTETTVTQCVRKEDVNRCSDPLTVRPVDRVTPFEVSYLGNCAANASELTIGGVFGLSGTPGVTPVFTEIPNTQNVEMSWPGGAYGSATFTNVMCSPPTGQTEPPANTSPTTNTN
ncbi:Ig-like domain-containing protein [Leucobacter sp. cx-328]|uniref:Ig-like domain-containing protein n=1 Tax=unclassified Leucobacter TaxID=2621730 RepID=UPI00165E4DDE|nr:MULTISPECIES: Ig-like domain-containing protein [unclassified Leucobacter]MBC9944584.1 Ig-like domain-containing protein [Leucobacter sp. cx-328]